MSNDENVKLRSLKVRVFPQNLGQTSHGTGVGENLKPIEGLEGGTRPF